MDKLSSHSSTDFENNLIRFPYIKSIFDSEEPYFSQTGTVSEERYGFTSTLTTIDENYLNHKRLLDYQKQFSQELIGLFKDDDFEYGIQSKADILIQTKMQENALATKSWLNHIFIENFNNVSVLLGVLRIVARLEYFQVYPEGPTMAVAALSHKNEEVQECGVRAFESWETSESLVALQHLKANSEWLQDYIDNVVNSLKRKFNV